MILTYIVDVKSFIECAMNQAAARKYDSLLMVGDRGHNGFISKT